MRLHIARSIVLIALSGVCALGPALSAAGQIEDFRSIEATETTAPEEVGPFFLSLPAGFSIPLELEITNALDVEIDGQRVRFDGVGAAFEGSGVVSLDAGQTYDVMETYTVVARVSALFVQGRFPVSVEAQWNFTAPESGDYEFAISGAVRQLSVELSGGISGSVAADAVGSTLSIDVTLTDAVEEGDVIQYQATFTGVLDRSATFTRIDAPSDEETIDDETAEGPDADEPPTVEEPNDEPADENATPPTIEEPDGDPDTPVEDGVDEDATEEPGSEEDEGGRRGPPEGRGGGNGPGRGVGPPTDVPADNAARGLERARERLERLADRLDAPGLEIAHGRLAELLERSAADAEAALEAGDAEEAELQLEQIEFLTESLERETETREAIAEIEAEADEFVAELQAEGVEPPSEATDRIAEALAAAENALSLNHQDEAATRVEQAKDVLAEVRGRGSVESDDAPGLAERAREAAGQAGRAARDGLDELADVGKDVPATARLRSVERAIRNAERAIERAEDATASALATLDSAPQGDATTRQAAEDAVNAAIEALDASANLTTELRDRIDELTTENEAASQSARERAQSGNVGRRRAAESELADAEAIAERLEEAVSALNDIGTQAAEELTQLVERVDLAAESTQDPSLRLLAEAVRLATQDADAVFEGIETWASDNLALLANALAEGVSVTVETDALEAELRAKVSVEEPPKQAQRSARDAAKAANRAAQQAAKAAREAEKAADRAARSRSGAAQAAAENARRAAERAQESAERAEQAARRAGREATDLNDDGKNNIIDLILVAQVFGMAVEIDAEIEIADITGDGVVDIADLALAAQGFLGGVLLPVTEDLIAAAPLAPQRATMRLEREGQDQLRVFLDAPESSELRAVAFRLFYDPEVVALDGAQSKGMPLFQNVTDEARGERRVEAARVAEEGPLSELTLRILADDWRLRDAVRIERVVGADASGRQRSLAVENGTSAAIADLAPVRARLYQNYPNPFNPETWIPYQLSEAAEARIRIYDLSGRLVRALNLGRQSAGYHVGRRDAAYWDGRNEKGEPVAGGVYFYEFNAGAYRDIRRLVIVK